MQEDHPPEATDDSAPAAGTSHSSEEPAGSRMHARTWVLAANYRDPADYDVPELPTWYVSRPDEGGIALAADPSCEPFIAAADPMRVRR
jgi:hypothetical protein